MAKEYKVGYKTYLNDRLKETDFHGKQTFPLYVQVTFERRSIFFKSYYFELLAQSRYARQKVTPVIADVIRLEEQLAAFIIERNRESFSLELFKEQYTYYCIDLCTVTTPDFSVYLDWFFRKKNNSALGSVISRYHEQYPLYEVLQDMQQTFTAGLYETMIEQSFSYSHFGAPYLLLSGFMQQIKKSPLLLLTHWEWVNEDTQIAFTEYVQREYPDKDPARLTQLIQKRLALLKNRTANPPNTF